MVKEIKYSRGAPEDARGGDSDDGFGPESRGGVYVEVLRASPVKITGVQRADLVGCPKDDRLF
jgi:hypothetical protein